MCSMWRRYKDRRMTSIFESLFGSPPEMVDLDDDFHKWCTSKGVDLKKSQYNSPEIKLFQALFKEIKK